MPFKIHKQGVTVNVRLTPGARHDGIAGVVDAGDGKKALKISVRSPPEDGKANKELLALLAQEWGLPKSAFSLLSGDTNRQKVVLVAGDGQALFAQLAAWSASLD
ncbi:MAG: DUF167 domain-containing protein [Alphaproteobacteria bacterium]|nr:MAG: DUF167 domain-containing protein [Alphaproteobacteria bacterium]